MPKHLRDRDRFSIITDDLSRCYECGRPRTDLHELMFGTANRGKSKDDGLVLPLCREHHRIAHTDPKVRRKYCELAQRAFEKAYPGRSFLERYGHNYL